MDDFSIPSSVIIIRVSDTSISSALNEGFQTVCMFSLWL